MTGPIPKTGGGRRGRPFPCVLALALWGGAAAAQDGWDTSCDAEGRCTVALAVAASDTGQRAATFFAVVSAAPMRVGAVLPLGIAADAGVRMIVGGDEPVVIAAPVRVCYPDGCRATADLSEPEAAALAAADSIEIRYFPFGADAPVAVPIPLTGFGDRLAALPAR